jgi:hypothetical protein
MNASIVESHHLSEQSDWEDQITVCHQEHFETVGERSPKLLTLGIMKKGIILPVTETN